MIGFTLDWQRWFGQVPFGPGRLDETTVDGTANFVIINQDHYVVETSLLIELSREHYERQSLLYPVYIGRQTNRPNKTRRQNADKHFKAPSVAHKNRTRSIRPMLRPNQDLGLDEPLWPSLGRLCARVSCAEWAGTKAEWRRRVPQCLTLQMEVRKGARFRAITGQRFLAAGKDGDETTEQGLCSFVCVSTRL